MGITATTEPEDEQASDLPLLDSLGWDPRYRPNRPGADMPSWDDSKGADMPSWDDSNIDSQVDGAMPSIMNDTDDGSWDDWDNGDDNDNTPDDIQILITTPQDGGMPSVSDLDEDWIDGAMPSIDDGAMP